MSKEEPTQIPDLLYDTNAAIPYKKGRFFGKGGFAKCYELMNLNNNLSYAGKIIPKKLLAKKDQKQKMSQEIQIHQKLRHKHIVEFHNFFEDANNIYLVLELCRKRSMMELHKRRRTLTEPETRYYMKQILSGVQYLHHNSIIHRDLKLGNLFLNDGLEVKIGDFGLAAKIEYAGERKKTLCGTPNYIAPEILTKKGHSFEVDIWSIGCIMYTLLIGMPPFETSTLQETYAKIKKCDYKISRNVSESAKHMIMLMIQSDPNKRPKVGDLIRHDFLLNGYCPQTLPTSCLTMAPRFDKMELLAVPRKPLFECNYTDLISPAAIQKKKNDSIAAGLAVEATETVTAFDAKQNFIDLRAMLLRVLKSKPAKKQKILDEMTDPAAQPMIWVSKWVDYSDKYGFGYQLSDEAVGVMFNDTTKLIMLPNGINVHYVDKHGDESYMTVSHYPKQYEKKMKLLSYFTRYMNEHLIKTGADVVKEGDTMSRTPHLHQWCRSTSGVLMQLNNGSVQMNFGDHTKIILCPLMAAITLIDGDRSFRTFRFSTIEQHGCSGELYEKMRYAFEKITVLLESESK